MNYYIHCLFQYGWNALDYTCYNDHEDVVCLLINDPNWVKNGKTFFFNESSLHIACRTNRVRIAIELLKNGAGTLINDKTFVSRINFVLV